MLLAIFGLFVTITPATQGWFDPDDFAVEVVESIGLGGTGIYNDPAAILGPPALYFNESMNPSVPDVRRVKLIEPAWNLGPDGEKLLTTLSLNTSVTVRMGRPVYNDPLNPFGIDLIVFGNSFFSGGGAEINDQTDLNLFTLTNPASINAERVKVSVSPDGIDWYRFDSGPYADGLFPTNAFLWDRDAAMWTDQPADPNRPVNPALQLSDFSGLTAADALDLYQGSMGGTGFDLSETGFDWIQYVRFEGLSGFANGEIDAVARVRARLPGDIDGNGRVDDADLVVLQTNLGMSPAGWEHGDFDGDGVVSLYDAYLLFRHYESSAALTAVSMIPEPAGVLVLLTGCLCLLRRQTN